MPPPTPNESGLCASMDPSGATTPNHPATRTEYRIRIILLNATLERFQILFQIVLLLPGELQVQHLHIMLDDSLEGLGAAIVEVGRMLPQSAERRGAVPFLSRPRGVGRVHPGLRGRMENPGVVVGEIAVHMAPRAVGIKDHFASSRRPLAVAAGGRRGSRNAELIGPKRGQLGR